MLQIIQDDTQIWRASCATIAAQARRRWSEAKCVVTLDAWHALSRPLFCPTCPAVPWVFLDRDPVEVPASQMKARGQPFPGDGEDKQKEASIRELVQRHRRPIYRPLEQPPGERS